MRKFKFKSYDRGNVRCYFKQDKTLYCIQPDYRNLPELLICSRDGEPSHPVYNTSECEFTSMPYDGNTWQWDDIFKFIESQPEISIFTRFNELFQP